MKMGSEDFADMLMANGPRRLLPGWAMTSRCQCTIPAIVLDDKILPIGASMFARIVETRLPVATHA